MRIFVTGINIFPKVRPRVDLCFYLPERSCGRPVYLVDL